MGKLLCLHPMPFIAHEKFHIGLPAGDPDLADHDIAKLNDRFSLTDAERTLLRRRLWRQFASPHAVLRQAGSLCLPQRHRNRFSFTGTPPNREHMVSLKNHAVGKDRCKTEFFHT